MQVDIVIQLFNIGDDSVDIFIQACEYEARVSFLSWLCTCLLLLGSENHLLETLKKSLLLRSRLLRDNASNGLVLLRNLLFWERWSIGKSKSINFSDSSVCMGGVLLGPSSVSETCFCVLTLHLVLESILVLIDVTCHGNTRSEVGNFVDTILIVRFNLTVLIIVEEHHIFSLVLTQVVVVVIVETVAGPSCVNVT